MNGTDFMKINADAMEQILMGELIQKANRFNPTISSKLIWKPSPVKPPNYSG